MLSITVTDGRKVLKLDKIKKVFYEEGVLVITSENRCNPNEIDKIDFTEGSDDLKVVITKKV